MFNVVAGHTAGRSSQPTPLAPLGEIPRPFGFGSPPDARSSLRDAARTLPLALTTETAKTGAASPRWLLLKSGA
ncbi:MAG: hypothetical protein V7L21_11965 [Nostoc sp.]|uniref:hypothetical protein n=1 Tax=unclassified Nostoc TaxID=2593658 RepID=UPI0025DF26EA|nr:hypothetical protein [Nostoc sp. NMS9]MBN3939695.1 hypothetical protein [Nostoc sp. NMS9]